MPRGRGRKRSTATANLSHGGPRQTRARTSQGRSESGSSRPSNSVNRPQTGGNEPGSSTSIVSSSVSRPRMGETSALNQEVVSNESQNGGPGRSEAGTSAVISTQQVPGPSGMGRGQLLGEISALNPEAAGNGSQNGGPGRSEAGTSAVISTQQVPGPSVTGRAQLLGVNSGNSSVPFITTSYNVTTSQSSNNAMINTMSSVTGGCTPMANVPLNNAMMASNQATIMSGFLNHAPNQLQSVCEPLSISVSQSLRAKIVKGEYIDLALLLEQNQKINEPVDMKLVVDEKGSFVWKANKPDRKINSIHSWTSAFLVFSSVYLQAHPHRTQELLKYMHIVRTASRHSPSGWMAFDVQRRLRQAQYPDRSWAILDGELWAMYVTAPAFRQFPFTSGQQNQGFRAFRGNATSVFDRLGGKTASKRQWWRGAARQGMCFAFNRAAGCKNKNCQYKHKCVTCTQEGHGAFKCSNQ